MILLLENKIDRESRISLDDQYITNILGDKDCNVELDNFLEDNTIFDKYNTIIIHETIYDKLKRDELFQKLKAYCHQKNLVIFSGGKNPNYVTIYNEHYIEISALRMYKNIKEFVGNSSEILILAYGKQWELNVFLGVLEKLNLFIENNTGGNINISIFKRRTEFSKLKNIDNDYYSKIFANVSGNILGQDKVILIRDNLKHYIQSKVNE